MDYLMLHIEYLLLRHDCIIMPGFGALINRYEAARWDESNCRYIPMRKVISFNSMVTNDDGLLVNSYARYLKVSYSEARSILYKDIEILKQLLSSHAVIPLSNVGHFSMEDEDKIVFSPKNDNTSDLGYVTVCAPVLSNHNNSVPAERISSYKTKESEEVSEKKYADYAVNNDKDEQSNSRDYYLIKISRRFLRISAMIIGMAGVLALGILLPSYDREIHNEASVLPADRIIDTVIREINVNSEIKSNPSNQTPDSEFSQSADNKNIVADKEIEISSGDSSASGNSEISDKAISQKSDIETNNNDYRYYLIVGTFGSSSEARNFINSEKNANNLKLIDSPTLKRVSIAASDSKSDLQSIMNSSKIRDSYPQAWIWEKRK